MSLGRSKWAAREVMTPLQLFPAGGPIKFLLVDIQGPVWKAYHDNQLVVVMPVRYMRLTRALLKSEMTDLPIQLLFMDHSEIRY